MIRNAVQFEKGEFGARMVLTAPWSQHVHDEIIRVRPSEVELNTSKGWLGKDISFLKSYTWLKSIIIIDLKTDDLSPVLDLTNLINMDIITYCKKNLDFHSFPFLKKCSFEWINGSDSLFDCAHLTHLFINRYNGKTSAPFAKLINLEALAILNSPIVDVRGLAGLHHLRSLRLGELRALKSLEGIEDLHHLKSFEMQTCKSVKSLDPLSRLRSLTKVNFSNDGPLDSLCPLGDLPNLDTVLFYDSTNISDGNLWPIFDNPNIQNVSFQNRRHYSHRREDFENRNRRHQ